MAFSSYICIMNRWILLPLLLLWAAGLRSQTTEPSPEVAADSVSLSAPLSNAFPYWCGPDMGLWMLHPGLNTQLSLSATVGTGHGSPSGVGFGRSLGMVYASQPSSPLFYTLGVHTSQLSWGGRHLNEAALLGSVGYQLSDKVSLSLEGYKEMVHPTSRPLRESIHREHYLGGALNMKFTDNVFVTISLGTSAWSY